MNRKIIVSIILVVAVMLTSVPVYAASGDSVAGGIVSRDTVIIEGVPVTFIITNKNGVLSETVSIDPTIKLDADAKARILKKVIQISDERAARHMAMSKPINSSQKAVAKIGRHWTEKKSNSAYGTGAGENPRTYAGHWSTVDYTVIENAGSMYAYGGASRVVYDGGNPVNSMSILETITRQSWSISVSYPPSFSISSDEKSATLSDYYYKPSVPIGTMYRLDMSADTILNIGRFVTIQTDTSVQIGTNTYRASVSSVW